MRTLLALLALVIAGALSALLVAAKRWNADSAALVRQLVPPSAETARSLRLSEELATLPPPVRRYLSAALGEDPPTIRFARIEHVGEFLLKSPNEWRSFRSTEYFATQPPGFIWDARIRMAPGLDVRARDALLRGTGSTLGRIAGVFKVVDVQGTPDIASGALYRYLAEAVWLPTALIPSAGVQWTAIDDSTAHATLGIGETSVSLEFHFGSDGLVQRVYTASRAREVGGKAMPTPWEGRFSRYETRHGFLIPIEGEVAWLLPSGRETYWRGRVAEIEYNSPTQ